MRKSTDRMTRSSIWGLAEPVLGFRGRTISEGGSQWKEKGSRNHTGGFTSRHSSCPVHSGRQGQAAPVLCTPHAERMLFGNTFPFPALLTLSSLSE